MRAGHSKRSTCGVSVEHAAASLVGLLVAHEVGPGFVGGDPALLSELACMKGQRALLACLAPDLRELHKRIPVTIVPPTLHTAGQPGLVGGRPVLLAESARIKGHRALLSGLAPDLRSCTNALLLQLQVPSNMICKIQCSVIVISIPLDTCMHASAPPAKIKLFRRNQDAQAGAPSLHRWH